MRDFNDENDNKSLTEILACWKAELKQFWETSKFYRNSSLRKVTKAINTLKSDDEKTIKQIAELIVSLDLCDDRYGKTIDKNNFKKLLEVVHENPNLVEVENNLRKHLVCYKEELEQK